MNTTNDSGTLEAALEWIERYKGGTATGAESEAFFDWLTESPRHVEVFLQALTLDQRLSGIASEQWTALGVSRGKNAAGDLPPANVIPLDVRPAVTAKPAGLRWNKQTKQIAAVAAGIAVLVAAGWRVPALIEGRQDYSTSVGEQQAVRLADGSIVNLNTGSHLKVRIDAESRDLWLTQGEALFKVQQDSTRPFRVHTRDAVIQAIGTQFNVYTRDTGTTVSVIEGRVRVGSTPVLSAGEAVNVKTNGKVERRASVNADRVTSWQRRRLIFDEETLTNIVAEFNRYNQRHLTIEDPAAGSRRFSGIFDVDDPKSLADLLSRESELRIEDNGAEVIIRRQAQ